MTDRSYAKQEVLEMESKIIQALDFNLTVPSPLRFLDRYARIISGDQRVYFLARYLIEIALLNECTIKHSASNVAASALYLSMKIYKKKECWNNTLAAHAKYKETQVRPVAKDLCLMLQEYQSSKLSAIRRKFQSQQYLEISKIHIDKVQQP